MTHSESITGFLYNGWLIGTVKALFLIVGIVFLLTVLKTYPHLERTIDTLYFTRFADQSVDAIGVLSPRGTVVYWNKGAERLYEQPSEQVIGKHIKRFLVPDELHSDIDEKLKGIRASKKSEHFRAPRLKSDKSEVIVDTTISPFFLENGTFGGYFGIMRPVNPAEVKTQGKVPTEDPFISNQPKTQEGSSLDDLVRRIANSVAKEELVAEKHLVFTGTLAATMLLFTSVLVLFTLIASERYKYIFGSGAVILLLIEIWLLRYFVRNRGNTIRVRAIQRLLDLPNIDGDRVKMALEIMSAVGQGLTINFAAVPPSEVKKE